MPAPCWLCRVSVRAAVTDETPSLPRRIVVTAAVIEQNGRFLVTRRPRGVHLEGLWEFPGGKCEPGETHVASLEREIAEELSACVVVRAEVFSVTHAYLDRVVELHFFDCRLTGSPVAVLGQEMRWCRGRSFGRCRFLPPMKS